MEVIDKGREPQARFTNHQCRIHYFNVRIRDNNFLNTGKGDLFPGSYLLITNQYLMPRNSNRAFATLKWVWSYSKAISMLK